MPARWQARPPTSGPFIRSAVQISFTRSAWNRPYARGGCPPGGWSARGPQTTAGSRARRAPSPAARPAPGGPARRSARSSLSSARPLGPPRRGLPRRGHQRVKAPGTAGGDPPVDRLARYRHRVPDGPACSRPASSRTTWPRCRDVRASSMAGSISDHRHSAMVCARCRLAAASRSAAVICFLLRIRRKQDLRRPCPARPGVRKSKRRPWRPGSCCPPGPAAPGRAASRRSGARPPHAPPPCPGRETGCAARR